MMVVADPKTTSRDDNTRRPPLLPSERDNAKKPKARHVSSRYLSPSPSPSPSTSTASRRSPSPLVSRNSTPPVKRSVSVDRKRPVGSRPLTPDLVSRPGEISAATKLLVTSTRSLSVSFQGEAFSLPVSKTKLAPPAPTPNLRKTTPERKRTNTPSRSGGDHLENSRPIDQQRWPGRTRQEHPLSRSLDCTGDRSKLAGSGNVIRALKQSMVSESRRASLDGNAQCLKPFQHTPDGNSQSDTESVSSGSNSGAQECGRGCGGSVPPGISVSARFWQETNTRLRRLQDPGSQLSTSPGSKIAGPPKFIQSKKYPSDGSVVSLSSQRKMASPLRGGTRPASPSKLNSQSLSRGMMSPSRVRSAFAATTTSTSTSSSGNFSEAPSVLSYAVDVRRGKVGENRIVDAHLLRLLYNRQLQWRFVNARTEAALRAQKRSAEKTLWNAWITISDLRDSVTKRRHRLQLMRQKLKLASILKKQITFLEDWASLDKDHYVSLLGAIEALKASTLRLPVIGGAIADIQSMKDAISSAFDVMQAMASSICSHLSKVDEVDSLLAELANETANERALLQQCKDFLSMLAAMQVTDCSLRTHILQLNRVPST